VSSGTSQQLGSHRDLPVLIVAWIFIAAGAVGLVYHSRDVDPRRLGDPDVLAPLIVRLLAVAGGVFLLLGHNWARWLLVVWLGYHVVLSAFHSSFEFVFHAVLLVVVSWVLFHERRWWPRPLSF
jgi:hypothetical protein